MANLSNINFTDSIQDALGGDQQAFAFLYNETYGYFRSIVVKCIGAGSNTDDVMQNIYIKIFRELHTLRDPQTFLKWGAVIARREALNEYKKSKALKNDLVDYYPQTAPEDDDGISMEDFSAPDYDTDINPEAAMDAAETKRLVQEILDTLPDSQRICLVMWMDNFTYQQIAEEMAMKPGTVRSNIRYAKQKVEQQVRALEKRGTKLYSLAPFAFFVWLYRMYSRSTLEVQAAELGVSGMQVFEKVMEQTVVVSKAAGTAGQTAAQTTGGAIAGQSAAGTAAGGSAKAGISAAAAVKAAAAAVGKSAAGRILIAVLCAALAGSAGAAVAYNVSEMKTDTEIVEDAEEETAEAEEETAEAEAEMIYTDPDELASDLGYTALSPLTYDVSFEIDDYYIMMNGIEDAHGYVAADFRDLDADGEEEFYVLSFSSDQISADSFSDEDIAWITSGLTESLYAYTLSVYEKEDGWALSDESFFYTPASFFEQAVKTFYVSDDAFYMHEDLVSQLIESVEAFQMIVYESGTLRRVKTGTSYITQLPVYRMEAEWHYMSPVVCEALEEELKDHDEVVFSVTPDEYSMYEWELTFTDACEQILQVTYSYGGTASDSMGSAITVTFDG